MQLVSHNDALSTSIIKSTWNAVSIMVTRLESARLMKLWLNHMKSNSPYLGCLVMDFELSILYSKGDIKSAAKFLEMFVSVAEKAGLQESLADACSAIGTMYNTMVSK